MSDTNTLIGRRVLITEDEAIIAMDLEQILEGAGCKIVGIARTIEQALGVLATEEVDLALLDVNLGGAEVFPVAAKLSTMKIPFFFLTGYNCEHLPHDYKDSICLEKPVQEALLLKSAVEVCSVEEDRPNASSSTASSVWPPLR